jgi:hypothetical protein
MAYKRTSKKTGGTTRRTHTINTNGSETNSFSQGTKNFRTTYSNNSKTGSKVTQTYRDGGGFIHTRVLSKTKSAAALEREHKRERKFWSNLFGSKKKQKNKSPTLGNYLALGVLIFFLVLYLRSA